jgi:hypothetical protein
MMSTAELLPKWDHSTWLPPTFQERILIMNGIIMVEKEWQGLSYAG